MNQDLHATRGVEAKASLGDFYVVDLRRHHVIDSRVDIETLAKDLELPAPPRAAPRLSLPADPRFGLPARGPGFRL